MIVSFKAFRESHRLKCGLERLYKGLNGGHVIGLMCSEKDPKDCHRHFIVGESLEQGYKGVEVRHIVSIDAEVKWQTNAEIRGERNRALCAKAPLSLWLETRRGLFGGGEPAREELEDLCDRYWNLLHGWKLSSKNTIDI